MWLWEDIIQDAVSADPGLTNFSAHELEDHLNEKVYQDRKSVV